VESREHRALSATSLDESNNTEWIWLAPRRVVDLKIIGGVKVQDSQAFLSGANQWSRQKKILFANDLENKDHLLAVYRSANRSKRAKGPARWLPPNTA